MVQVGIGEEIYELYVREDGEDDWFRAGVYRDANRASGEALDFELQGHSARVITTEVED